MCDCSLLPSILVKDEKTFKERLAICEGAVNTVHIDIADGSFVPNTSWADPDVISKFKTKLKFELHLMVNDPNSICEEWADVKNVKKIITHVESSNLDASNLNDLARKNKWDVLAGFKLDTDPANYKNIVEQMGVSGVLLMGIHKIGFSGQEIDLDALKILLKKIKTIFPKSVECDFEIDGGVGLMNSGELKGLGFDKLIMASEIFSHENPRQRLEQLLKQI